MVTSNQNIPIVAKTEEGVAKGLTNKFLKKLSIFGEADLAKKQEKAQKALEELQRKAMEKQREAEAYSRQIRYKSYVKEARALFLEARALGVDVEKLKPAIQLIKPINEGRVSYDELRNTLNSIIAQAKTKKQLNTGIRWYINEGKKVGVMPYEMAPWILRVQKGEITFQQFQSNFARLMKEAVPKRQQDAMVKEQINEYVERGRAVGMDLDSVFKRIEEVLIEKGVNPKDLSYKAGFTLINLRQMVEIREATVKKEREEAERIAHEEAERRRKQVQLDLARSKKIWETNQVLSKLEGRATAEEIAEIEEKIKNKTFDELTIFQMSKKLEEKVELRERDAAEREKAGEEFSRKLREIHGNPEIYRVDPVELNYLEQKYREAVEAGDMAASDPRNYLKELNNIIQLRKAEEEEHVRELEASNRVSSLYKKSFRPGNEALRDALSFLELEENQPLERVVQDVTFSAANEEEAAAKIVEAVATIKQSFAKGMNPSNVAFKWGRTAGTLDEKLLILKNFSKVLWYAKNANPELDLQVALEKVINETKAQAIFDKLKESGMIKS